MYFVSIYDVNMRRKGPSASLWIQPVLESTRNDYARHRFSGLGIRDFCISPSAWFIPISNIPANDDLKYVGRTPRWLIASLTGAVLIMICTKRRVCVRARGITVEQPETARHQHSQVPHRHTSGPQFHHTRSTRCCKHSAASVLRLGTRYFRKS